MSVLFEVTVPMTPSQNDLQRMYFRDSHRLLQQYRALVRRALLGISKTQRERAAPWPSVLHVLSRRKQCCHGGLVLCGKPGVERDARGQWRCKAHKGEGVPGQPRGLRVLRASFGELDDGNLVGGCKPLIDAVVQEGLLYDDSPAWLRAEYEQTKAARNNGWTSVTVIGGGA